MNINLLKYGKGLPLVFFHGWGFDNQIWMTLFPYLQHSYEMILVDLPGFGLTPMQPWDSFKSSLLEQLPSNFILVGWSLGGLLATRLAIEDRARVSHLINISSSPRFLSDVQWPGVDNQLLQQFHHKLVQNSQVTLQEFIKLQAQPQSFDWEPAVYPSPAALEYGLKILQDWDLRSVLHHLDMPVSFMFGRLDPITPVKIMKTMEFMYPQFNYVVFKRSAHMPFISHTEQFVEELRTLLA